MKARVKESGEIVEVVHYSGYGDYDYICHENVSVYDAEELEFEDDPDYWTRLEHQYAGMAMQGLVTCGEVLGATKQEIAIEIADISDIIAHTLIQKLMEKEEKK
jgi:hypothetical protein